MRKNKTNNAALPPPNRTIDHAGPNRVAGEKFACPARQSCAQPWPAAERLTYARLVVFCSHIRETMVKIMLSPVSRRQSLGDDCAEAKPSDAVAMRWGFGHTFDGKGLPIGPSNCIFWCAVALGALVKGGPVEPVSKLLTPGVYDCMSRGKGAIIVVHHPSAYCETFFFCDVVGFL